MGRQRGCSGGSEPWGVQVSTVSFRSGMAVNLATGADAVGEHTYSGVEARVTVVDRGMLTYATGMSFAVAGSLSEAGGAYASTYSQLDIAGADYADIRTHCTEGMAEDGTSAVSTVGTSFFAVDCKWLDFSIQTGEETFGQASPPAISGNLADFSASIEAQGDNGYVELLVDALAIEDQLSSTVLSATAAIDGSVTYQRYLGTSRDNTIRTDDADALVQAGRGHDRITTGGGDDWIFGEAGRDRIESGAGDDVVLGGNGDDSIRAGAGDDWLFGGRGDDQLEGGGGNDLIMGGEGRDRISGGDGDDLIDAGRGNDTVHGGAGNDVFRLGAERDDGKDCYWGDAGADLYVIAGKFGSDVISDFSLGQGDRLSWSGADADDAYALRQLNGSVLTLQRAANDSRDLVMGFRTEDGRSELRFDNFFVLNREYAWLPRHGAFSDDLAASLLHDMFSHQPGTPLDQSAFGIGDYLSDLG